MIHLKSKRIQAVFFRTASGVEPVRKWLKAMGKRDKVLIGTDIRTVEMGWPIGMPVCRKLVEDIFEVRTTLKDTIARVLFAIEDGDMILLEGIIKKQQKTPADAIELAKSRLRLWRRNHEEE